MQMCESRLQPTPVLALQSSVLQDSVLGGGGEEAGCIPLQALHSLGARRAFARLPVSVHRSGSPGCGTFAPHLTLQSANSPVCMAVTAAGGGRRQGETGEVASVKRAGKMTEA